MKFEKGKTGNPNGRPKGIPNKSTLEFKEAINNLLEYAAPQMVDWLIEVAADDKLKALNYIKDMAEFAHPKLARTELTGKDGGAIETKAITKTDEEILNDYMKRAKE